jgi:hypothetical protein
MDKIEGKQPNSHFTINKGDARNANFPNPRWPGHKNKNKINYK